jgi:hypothetical protein
MYLAILFANDIASNETLSCSAEVDTDDKRTIFELLCKNANVSVEEVDTILVVENGGRIDPGSPPKVLHYWTGRNGDFDEYVVE